MNKTTTVPRHRGAAAMITKTNSGDDQEDDNFGDIDESSSHEMDRAGAISIATGDATTTPTPTTKVEATMTTASVVEGHERGSDHSEDSDEVNDDRPTTTTSNSKSARGVHKKKKKMAAMIRSCYKEFRHIMDLAVPTVIVQLGMFAPPFFTASYVGRGFGSTYLSGFQLANLIGNLFVLTILQGLYSASDTLSPQAYGAGNFREVGLIAVRGLLLSLAITMPINLSLVLSLKTFLISVVGIDPIPATYASEWYNIYSISLPFYAIYMVLWKFLSAQNVMMPLVVACIVNCFVTLPISLEYGVQWFGFRGTAGAVVLFQIMQPLIVVLYLKIYKPHHPQTWPFFAENLSSSSVAVATSSAGATGSSSSTTIPASTSTMTASLLRLCKWFKGVVADTKPIKEYFHLGMGGVVASSEWVYWELLSLTIGTLGVIPMSVHSVATQVLTVAFLIPYGIGIALAIRLGMALPRNAHQAKKMAAVTFIVSAIFYAIASYLVHVHRYAVYRMFTTESAVVEGCEEMWWKLCLYVFLLSLYAMCIGIATGLGMQWTLGAVTFAALWLLGFPTAWYIGVIKAASLTVVWTYIFPPYIVMNIILVICFTVTDWESIAAGIRNREGMMKLMADEKVSDDTEAPGYGATIEVQEKRSLLANA